MAKRDRLDSADNVASDKPKPRRTKLRKSDPQPSRQPRYVEENDKLKAQVASLTAELKKLKTELRQSQKESGRLRDGHKEIVRRVEKAMKMVRSVIDRKA